MERTVKAILVIIIIAAVLAVPGMALQSSGPSTQAAGTMYSPSSRVLFLEHYLLANGSVVKGEAPFRSVNFPTYWYNENTKQLNGKIDFPVNNSLIIIFGDVLTLKGNFGAGTGNKLFGVYSLPTRLDQAVVYSTDMSGNIIMNVNKRTFVLKPGDAYTYSENETFSQGKALVKVAYNHTYVNHGYIDKNSIKAGLVTS